MSERLCIVHAPVWLNLGAGFSDQVEPALFPEAKLRYRNQVHAARIGLDSLSDDEWQAAFHRFEPMRGNLPAAHALRYHGHQFRSYNPELGDGRGFLYAQVRDLADGRLLDLATKGSGQTPYSRAGDGRLTLKGGVREILASSLLEALGVYTSKALSLYETGETLHRHDEPSPTRSAVLVRLGHSHLRLGTFQYHAAHQDRLRVERLIDYALEYLLPEAHGELGAPADRLLTRVVARSARLVAEWMAAGFVHGVLNTDNMVVTGESFDYGPWRFLPHYDPTFTAAYFDHSGLYAFGQQPSAVLWNLERFADTMQGLYERSASDTLQSFMGRFGAEFCALIARRMGLKPTEDLEMLHTLSDLTFTFLKDERVPFDQFFFDWWGGEASKDRALESPYATAYAKKTFFVLQKVMEKFVPEAAAPLQSSYFEGVRPEGLLYEEVEAIWAAIANNDNWEPFVSKLKRLKTRRTAELGHETSEAGRPQALR